MTSWRDDTSSQAQADLDALLDAALGSAEELLGGEGSLRPFALVVTAEGGLEGRAVDAADAASATDLVVMLADALRADRHVLRATALVFEVVLQGDAAVQVELEHQEKGAPALVIAAPFTRTSGAVSIDGVKAARGTARVWS